MNEEAQLGANLREARTYLGLSLESVSRHIGVTEGEIISVEAGERSVSTEELERLARFYRCSVPFLRGTEELTVPAALSNVPRWATLTSTDRDEILRFAYFLQHSGTASPHSSVPQGERP
jgi:transcriptional regulator with XRE-family HTH domain